jgi:hypothetical protein
MDMKSAISIEGKTTWDRIRNENLKGGAEVQNLLTELEMEQLQCFVHVKEIAKTRIVRRALELKGIGKRPLDQPGTREFSQTLAKSIMRRKSWQEIKKEDCGKTEGIEDCHSLTCIIQQQFYMINKIMRS